MSSIFISYESKNEFLSLQLGQGHDHESSAHLASYRLAEQLVFLGVFLVRKRIEPLVVEPLHGIFQMTGAAGKQDSVVEIVHGELGYSAVEGHSLSIRQQRRLLLQMADDELGIGESPQIVAHILLLMHDGVFSRAVEICPGIGGDDSFSLQEEERGEFLVLVQDARGEALVLQDISPEDIAAG